MNEKKKDPRELCTHLRPRSANRPLEGEVTVANMLDSIDTKTVGTDDAIYEFRKTTLCRLHVVILLKHTVPACKDLVKKTCLVIARRLVEDLREDIVFEL